MAGGPQRSEGAGNGQDGQGQFRLNRRIGNDVLSLSACAEGTARFWLAGISLVSFVAAYAAPTLVAFQLPAPSSAPRLCWRSRFPRSRSPTRRAEGRAARPGPASLPKRSTATAPTSSAPTPPATPPRRRRGTTRPAAAEKAVPVVTDHTRFDRARPRRRRLRPCGGRSLRQRSGRRRRSRRPAGADRWTTPARRLGQATQLPPVATDTATTGEPTVAEQTDESIERPPPGGRCGFGRSQLPKAVTCGRPPRPPGRGARGGRRRPKPQRRRDGAPAPEAEARRRRRRRRKPSAPEATRAAEATRSRKRRLPQPPTAAPEPRRPLRRPRPRLHRS